MRILYVPSTILAAFKSAGFTPEDYLDVNKVLDILSPEDLAFYIYTNLVNDDTVPVEIRDSFNGNAMVLRTYLKEIGDIGAPWDEITDKELAKEVGRYINDYCLANAAPQLNLDGMDLYSEIVWVNGGEFMLFTHVPGTETSPVVKEKIFYRRLVTQLSLSSGIEDIAQKPLFARYLDASARALGQVHV